MSHLFLFMPGFGCTIHAQTYTRHDNQPDAARFYAAEIGVAIDDLHNSNIVYRFAKICG